MAAAAEEPGPAEAVVGETVLRKEGLRPDLASILDVVACGCSGAGLGGSAYPRGDWNRRSDWLGGRRHPAGDWILRGRRWLGGWRRRGYSGGHGVLIRRSGFDERCRGRQAVCLQNGWLV